jgi:hypothetical protein
LILAEIGFLCGFTRSQSRVNFNRFLGTQKCSFEALAAVTHLRPSAFNRFDRRVFNILSALWEKSIALKKFLSRIVLEFLNLNNRSQTL